MECAIYLIRCIRFAVVYVLEHRPSINFFQDSSFASFHKTLDGEMKRLRSIGHGVTSKQAEPLTIEEEINFGGRLCWEITLLKF